MRVSWNVFCGFGTVGTLLLFSLACSGGGSSSAQNSAQFPLSELHKATFIDGTGTGEISVSPLGSALDVTFSSISSRVVSVTLEPGKDYVFSAKLNGCSYLKTIVPKNKISEILSGSSTLLNIGKINALTTHLTYLVEKANAELTASSNLDADQIKTNFVGANVQWNDLSIQPSAQSRYQFSADSQLLLNRLVMLYASPAFITSGNITYEQTLANAHQRLDVNASIKRIFETMTLSEQTLAWASTNLLFGDSTSFEAEIFPTTSAPETDASAGGNIEVLGNVVSGVVRSASGAPIMGALVQLIDVEGSSKYIQTQITGADGVYQFVSVPAGGYYLNVDAKDFKTDSIQITVQ
jgi:hypothetical protein